MSQQVSNHNNNNNFLSKLCNTHAANSMGNNTMLQASVNGTQFKTVKRTLCVEINGNLADMAHQGLFAGLWKGVNGRESVIFQPHLGENMNSEQNTHFINSLRNGIIKRVVLKEQRSTFPFLMGVNISCVEPTEVTNLGEKFTYTVLPNSYINSEQVIYECNAETQDTTNWNSLFSKWNSENLDKEGVMDVPNQNFLFVHMNHPVIGLLRYNQHLIGCDIDSQPKLEKEYLKVSRQAMSTCCDTIRTDILNKMKTKDLTTFTIQLHRLNNAAWDEMDFHSTLGLKIDHTLSPEQQSEITHRHVRDFATKTYQYHARLEVEYEIPT